MFEDIFGIEKIGVFVNVWQFCGRAILYLDRCVREEIFDERKSNFSVDHVILYELDTFYFICECGAVLKCHVQKAVWYSWAEFTVIDMAEVVHGKAVRL